MGLQESKNDFEQGNQYLSKQMNEEAINCYNKVIQRDSKDKQSHKNKGFALYRLQRYNEALTEFDTALYIDPKYAIAYNNKGNSSLKVLQLNQLKQAMNCFSELTKLAPTHKMGWYHMGNTLRRLKLFEASLKSYNYALALDPKYLDCLNNQALSYKDMKNFDKALEICNKIIEMDSQYKRAYLNIGEIYKTQNNIEMALQYYDKVLEIDQNCSEAYNNKAIIYDAQQEYQSALEFYEKAIQLNPNNALYYNNKGVLLEHLNQQDEALVQYETALQINPNQINAINNKKKLISKIEQNQILEAAKQ